MSRLPTFAFPAWHRLWPALPASLAIACAGPAPHACPAGQRGMVSETVYFGTATPDGVVTAGDWQAFLDSAVTRRFPQGLTTWSASGQWRSAAGSVIREPSHVLSLVHDGGAASESALDAIVDEYKRRFRQEAVLRSRSPACVTF